MLVLGDPRMTDDNTEPNMSTPFLCLSISFHFIELLILAVHESINAYFSKKQILPEKIEDKNFRIFTWGEG